MCFTDQVKACRDNICTFVSLSAYLVRTNFNALKCKYLTRGFYKKKMNVQYESYADLEGVGNPNPSWKNQTL